MEFARRPPISPTNFPRDFSVIYSKSQLLELPDPDVHIVTSGGLCIPAHSSILASISPVLESIIERPQKRHSFTKAIPILCVPDNAVIALENLEKYGIHLLALAHVYLVPELKQRCVKDIAFHRLTVDNVVDVLQLAKLCDAPDLHVKCMKLIFNNFMAAQKTEGWKFLQNNDPRLELEVLELIEEAELVTYLSMAFHRARSVHLDDNRKKRSRKEETSLYLQLNEAMEGCATIGPHDTDPNQKRQPCKHFSTCYGLQILIKHFAACTRRINGRCLRCKRLWQLLRLHSSICDQSEDCKVPLCRRFKERKLQEKRKDEARWKLLVRKVTSAKALNSLSLQKRSREGASEDSIGSQGIRSLRLQNVDSNHFQVVL